MSELDSYRGKRDFEKTLEPSGGGPTPQGNSFVVQKHAARALHYDVRLEVDGVMPSWAVPKGPSYDPKVKRLAVHVEDHPIDYRSFEGGIPAGEYGGGTVIVWDEGTYRNLTEHEGKAVPMRAAIEGGHVSVWFEGTKLVGGWSFTRTGTDRSGKEQWIMVKRKDERADPTIDIEAAAPGSVQTGRTIEEVAADADAPTWTAAVATWQPPMLAEVADEGDVDRLAAEGDQWVYERKLDGLRCIAVRNGAAVELWSRNHLSFNERFGPIVAAIKTLGVDNVVLDGELVAFEGDRTSFGLLQNGGHPVYCVFDIVHLLGADTRGLPLADRRNLLSKLLTEDGDVRLVSTVTVDTASGDARSLLAQACGQGWEGLVAKRASSAYTAGRSRDWRKLKCLARQLIIGGWTAPRNSRVGFGALLMGYYRDGQLRYAGKVGTGFTQAMLKKLYGELVEREATVSPFAGPVPERSPHWARPDLVAEIAFSEWTEDGKLRHPRFVGLRPDKVPAEVVRETA